MYSTGCEERTEESKAKSSQISLRVKKEHKEGWNHSLNPELGPSVKRHPGEDWMEEADKYIEKLKEEERKIRLTEPWMGEGSTEGIEDKSTETKPDRRRI